MDKLKCRNFSCENESRGRKGYCLQCLHSPVAVVNKCPICSIIYKVTIGMEKKYCSVMCRTHAYKMKRIAQDV